MLTDHLHYITALAHSWLLAVEFWGVKIYSGFPTVWEVTAPDACIVQGSTEIY